MPIEEMQLAEATDRQAFELKLLLGEGLPKRLEIFPDVEISYRTHRQATEAEPNFELNGVTVTGAAALLRRDEDGSLVDVGDDDIAAFTNNAVRLELPRSI